MRNLTKTGSYISTRIGKAIADYDLIEDGDKILVAVSGGKDSMALVKLLNERRKWAPVSYDIIAVHIETDYRCAGCVHTKLLTEFFEENGIAYHFEKVKIMNAGPSPKTSSKARSKRPKISCFWCSWNRRKALFTLADKFGCNKVAFGHHKDDIIETLLLNMFFHGEFSAMNPRQELFGGKIILIRPLCYVEEEYTKKFSKESGFPSQMCRCPNAETSKRRMMKNFIKSVEKDCPHAKLNLFRSIARINKEYINIHSSEAPIDPSTAASAAQDQSRASKGGEGSAPKGRGSRGIDSQEATLAVK